MHSDARSFLTHCEQGFPRSHLSLAWRQWVQLSCIRLRFVRGCLKLSGLMVLVPSIGSKLMVRAIADIESTEAVIVKTFFEIVNGDK